MWDSQWYDSMHIAGSSVFLSQPFLKLMKLCNDGGSFGHETLDKRLFMGQKKFVAGAMGFRGLRK